MTPRTAFATVLLTTFSATGGRAETPDLETVLARHAEAVGCSAAAEIETLHLAGTYVYNSGEGAVDIWLGGDGRARLSIDGGQREVSDYGVWDTIDAEPGTVFVRVMDGEDGWFVSESNDVSGDLEDVDRSILHDFLDLGGPLCDATAKGHRIALEGVVSIEGSDAIHLTVGLAGGGTEAWYLDPETLLPKRREVPLAEEAKFYEPGVWVYDDYRAVSGVKLPFYVMAEESVFSRELMLDQAEAGIDVPPDLFERPIRP